MKIVIYDVDYTKPFSILCALVTGYSQSHAQVIQDGILYDTTLTKMEFTADSHKHQGKRLVTVFDVPDVDGTTWIKENIGVKYDVFGLLLWPLGVESKSKYYCFQIVEEILRANGKEINPTRGPVQAKNIFNYLTKAGYNCVQGYAEDLLP